MEFVNTELIFASVLNSHKPVIANAPDLKVNLPPGHPAMTAFMALPMMNGDELLGIAGVANRKGGYDAELADIWALGVCLHCFVYGRLPYVAPRAWRSTPRAR